MILIEKSKNKSENALSYWGKAFSFLPLLFFTGTIFLSSCNFFNKGKGKKIARVGSDYLYETDVKQVVPDGYTGKDSLEVIQTYINQWIKEKLAIQEALDNIKEMPEDLDEQVESYKNSLILYQYQKELLATKLDTTISNKEIEDYYAKNKSNFELKNNIIKVVYVKVDQKTKDLDKVRKWIKSSDPKDRKNLEDWCISGAINYYLDDNSWLIFDDLLKEIPIKTYDQEDFLENNRFVEIQDNSGLYLVNIKGFKTRDDISPISVEKENIQNILINKRKLNIIKEMEENQFKQGSEKGKFEIY
ncbi:MAG: hypothetical protein K1X82_11650 [Bacteroidia bacterium]|nr:hypothetical protein [Bacteroidia bacterium]